MDTALKKSKKQKRQRELVYKQLEQLGFDLPEDVQRLFDENAEGLFKQKMTVWQFSHEFLSFAGSDRKKMYLSMFLAFIGYPLSIVTLVFGAYAGYWIYQSAIGEALPLVHLIFAAGMSLVFALLYLVCTSVSTILSHRTAFNTLHNLRMALFHKLERMPLGYLVENSTGSLRHLIMQRTGELEDWIAHIMPEMPGRAVSPLISAIILFVIDWRLGLSLFVPILLIVLGYSLSLNKYLARMFVYMAASQALAGQSTQFIQGIPVIKAFLQDEARHNEYRKHADFFLDTTMAWWKQSWLGMALANAASICSVIVTGPLAFWLFSQAQIDMFSLILAIALSFTVLQMAMPVMMSFEVASMALPSWAAIRELAFAPELERPAQNQRVELDLSQPIRFKDVSFSYLSGHEVLHQLSFSCEAQQMTALVGPSGSGKSTVARLIASFWDTDSGSILFAGKNIKEIPLEQLMENIAYVAQDTFLFPGTIEDNLLMGKPSATHEELVLACQMAQCHDFIERLPKGYKTDAGEAGVLLSGGERQRITIARALLKDAPVVILDEATAYTDPENEAQIQSALNNLVQSKTLIVVAHKLNTITKAHKILVLDKGVVRDQGTHQELLKTSELYQKLWSQYREERDC